MAQLANQSMFASSNPANSLLKGLSYFLVMGMAEAQDNYVRHADERIGRIAGYTALSVFGLCLLVCGIRRCLSQCFGRHDYDEMEYHPEGIDMEPVR